MKLTLISVLIVFLFFKNSYSKVAIIEGDHLYLPLVSYSIFEDTSRIVSFKDIILGSYDHLFINNFNVEPKSNAESIYWVRFEVQNDLQEDSFILQVFSHEADVVSLFYPTATFEYEKATLGDQFPFTIRPYFYKDFIFDIPLYDHPGIYYLRFDPGSSINLSSMIWRKDKFMNFAFNKYIWYGIMYGTICFIGLINLFFFISLREKQYILYFGYIVSVLLFLITMDGTGFQFIWPDSPQFNKFSFSLFNTLMIIFSLWFSYSFLQLRNFGRIFLWLFILATCFKIGQFTTKFLLYNTFEFNIYLDIPILAIPFLSSIYVYHKDYKPARFFLVAYALLFTGYTLMILKVFQIGNLEYWAYDGYAYGLFAEIFFISIGLGDKMKILKNEKELATKKVTTQFLENERLKDSMNSALEELVKTRTAELKKANEKIEKMNALLKLDNRKLKVDVKKITKARIMVEDLDLNGFQNLFPDEESCFRFLSDLKWKAGFSCKKCNNNKCTVCKPTFSCRCTKCGYDESATIGSIFYHLHFSILKAFYITFIVFSNPEISGAELSRLLQMRAKTCNAFKSKVLEAMENKKKSKTRAKGWASILFLK